MKGLGMKNRFTRTGWSILLKMPCPPEASDRTLNWMIKLYNENAGTEKVV